MTEMTEIDVEWNRRLKHLEKMMATTTSVVTLLINSEGMTPPREAEVLAAAGMASEGLLRLHRATSAYRPTRLIEIMEMDSE